jgi:hypothetical protein
MACGLQYWHAAHYRRQKVPVVSLIQVPAHSDGNSVIEKRLPPITGRSGNWEARATWVVMIFFDFPAGFRLC